MKPTSMQNATGTAPKQCKKKSGPPDQHSSRAARRPEARPYEEAPPPPEVRCGTSASLRKRAAPGDREVERLGASGALHLARARSSSRRRRRAHPRRPLRPRRPSGQARRPRRRQCTPLRCTRWGALGPDEIERRQETYNPWAVANIARDILSRPPSEAMLAEVEAVLGDMDEGMDERYM